MQINSEGEVVIEGKEPQKLDLCGELDRHRLGLCAISEHRWRGQGSFRVNESWCLLFCLRVPLKGNKGWVFC